MSVFAFLSLWFIGGATLGLAVTLTSDLVRWFREDWRAERRWLFTVLLRTDAPTFNFIVIKARSSREAMAKREVGGLTWVLDWEDLPEPLQIHVRAAYALATMFPREGLNAPPPPELYWKAPLPAHSEILGLVRRTRWQVRKEV